MDNDIHIIAHLTKRSLVLFDAVIFHNDAVPFGTIFKPKTTFSILTIITKKNDFTVINNNSFHNNNKAS